MKKFLIKILIFLIPLVIYLMLTFFVDPYNFYDKSKVVSFESKKRIAYPLNYALWKTLEFEKHPVKNILLGDSRTNALDTEEIKRVSGLEFYNFAYGGGTLPEIIETFWFAQSHVKLKSVYIGLNLNLYNALNERNRVDGAVRLHSNFFKYAFSKFVFKSNWYVLADLIFGTKTQIGKPQMGKEDFWKYQLSVSAKNYYSRYKYPIEFFLGLKKISRYCDENNINLVFFIPPTHTDLQQKVEAYGLNEDKARFRQDLKLLAPVIDLNYPNGFTRDKNNFSDPFHPASHEYVICNLFKIKDDNWSR